WGRALFLGFYLVGGWVASLCFFALEPHSMNPMSGASGAVAACMGAFAVRFARRPISFLYFFWLLRRPRYGTVALPAWLGALFWFGDELRSFAVGDTPGSAAVAHVTGFAFGAAVALAMKGAG